MEKGKEETELEVLTNSAKSLYQECPREFQISYEQNFAPIKEASYFAFGTATHRAIELYYGGTEFEDIDFTVGLDDEFTIVKIREMMRGYIAHWGRFKKVLAIERQFGFPLLNPKTQSASRTFYLGGKIDTVVEDDGVQSVVEHKTSGDPIHDPACDYWLKLALDPQISGYFLGAEVLGFEPHNIIYDVLKKPTIKPSKETPDDKKKYKKDGTLYGSQNAADETAEAYGLRLRADIEEDPAKYYQRRTIQKLENDLVEFLSDSWAVGKLIMASRNDDFWPRRISQCFSYGRCKFYGVCAKLERLDDVGLFKKVAKNPELEEGAK